MNADVAAMLDKLSVDKLGPTLFEMQLAELHMYSDADLLFAIAANLGVTPAPVCVPNPKRLLADPDWLRRLADRVAKERATPDATAALLKFLNLAAEHGASVKELRDVMDGGSYDGLQVGINNIGARLNLKDQLPTLRLDPAYGLAQVEKALKQNYRVMDTPLRDFLTHMTATMSLDSATNWFAGSWDNADDKLGRQARLQHVSVPPVVFDFARLHQDCATTFKRNHAIYDTSCQEFVRTAVKAGIPAGKILAAFEGLGSEPDVVDLLRNANVFVAGMSLPTIRYDVAAIEKETRNLIDTTPPVLADSPRLQAFMQGLLDAGAASAQISSYCYQLFNYGAATAATGLGWVDQGWATVTGTPPALPVSLDALCANIKARLGTDFTAAAEQYVRQCYPLAEKSPRFCVSDLLTGDVPALCAKLAAMSGVPAPQNL